MSLKRLMLLRQLKTLLLDGKDSTARSVALGIAEDILDSENPTIRKELPRTHAEVVSNCAPLIIEEAKHQLRLDDWESDGDEMKGAA